MRCKHGGEAQFLERVVIVVQALVVDPHGDAHPRLHHVPDRRDAVADVQVAAGMMRDAGPRRRHGRDVGISLSHTAWPSVRFGASSPMSPRKATSDLPIRLDAVGALVRRLHRVDVHRQAVQLLRPVVHPAQEAFRGAVRPGRRQQDTAHACRGRSRTPRAAPRTGRNSRARSARHRR